MPLLKIYVNNAPAIDGNNHPDFMHTFGVRTNSM